LKRENGCYFTILYTIRIFIDGPGEIMNDELIEITGHEVPLFICG
jgi:hypothetical protein